METKDYGTAELPKPKPRTWTYSDYGLVASLFGLVFTLTVSTYYYCALLPAWEADTPLGWTRTSTLTVNWASTLLEALGLLFAGPLADYVEPVHLIILEGVVTFLGVFITSALQTSPAVIACLLSVSFLKGILWPSLGSIIFHSLNKEQQDVAFFCCALASRLSEALGGLALGQLLRCGLHWRSALVTFGTGLLAAFLSSIVSLQRFLSSGIHHEVDDPSSPTWTASYGAKWARLVGDINGWLALILLCGTGGIWALASYLALIMKEKFSLSSGAAAMAASSLLGGLFLGLLVAGISTYRHGHEHGRTLQLLQANTGLVSFAFMVLMPHLGLGTWVFCLLVAGAGSGPLLYLPYTVYCSTVPRSQRAFAMGVLDSLSQLFACLLLILFGHLRIVRPHTAGRIMYDVTTVGFAVTAAASMALYYRIGSQATQSHF